MITRSQVAGLVCLAAALSAVTVSCEKVPLLAPSGSSIQLISSTNVLPVNGTTEITAQVIEPSGTPPHSGTVVTFTTSLGTFQPATASTDVTGRASVTFLAGTQSGTANITALSGGASVSANGALKILIGSAAVGRVQLSANPSLVPASGGSSTITATVFDVNANVLPGATVTFSTTSGTLSTGVVSTDSSGNAQTVLRTTSKATVTATVGAQGGSTTTPPSTGGTTPTTPTTPSATGQATAQIVVDIASAPALVITPPTTPPSAGLPALFTFAVTAAAANGSFVTNVRVNWGDGSSQDLGAVTGNAVVAHTYQSAGTYPITATLTDSSGNTVPVSTSVSVVATALPTIVVTATSVPTVHAATMPVTFQLQVTTPTGVSIQSANIDWGDAGPGGTPAPGNVNQLGAINGTVTLTHQYTAAGTFTVVLRVTDSLNRTPFGTTTITLP